MFKRLLIQTYQQARRMIVIVVGFTILIIGIVMIALPGPAILVIPLGLTLLATEFIWAKNLLIKFKTTTDQITNPRNIRAFFAHLWSRGRTPSP